MAGDTPITLVGNLTADPELRFTPSGKPVVNVSIASTPRVFDRQSNEWKDGDTLFLRGAAWDGAENIAASLSRGTRVIVSGLLQQRSYETREGEKRSAYEIRIEEIGPSLRYAEAQVRKLGRGEKPTGGQQAQQSGGDDPWGSNPATAGAGNSAGGDPWNPA